MTCIKLTVLLFIGFIAAAQKDIITVAVPEVVLSEGANSKIRIMVQVKEGYHIQGNILKDESLIPTTLIIAKSEGLQTGSPVFPRAKKFKLEGSEEPLDVFDGSFEIIVPLQTQGVKTGTYCLEASLRYQACDARTCFFPKTKRFSIPVKVISQQRRSSTP